MIKQKTTQDFINFGKIGNATTDTIVKTEGFYEVGDGGAGEWKFTGTIEATGSPQTPAQRGAGELRTGDGRVWSLTGDSIHMEKIGWRQGQDATSLYNIAVSEANGSGAGALTLPSGEVLLNPENTLTVNEATLNIIGNESGRSALIRSGGNGVLIKLVKNVKRDAKITFTNKVTLIEDSEKAQNVAIRLTDNKTGVNGENDSLDLSGLEFNARNGGYWLGMVDAFNCGGIVGQGTRLTNLGSIAAQNDTSTYAIKVVNDDPSVDIIRFIDLKGFYFQRCNRFIVGEIIRSVESLYLTSGEMVGCDLAVDLSGDGKLGAVNISCHIDAITSCIKSRLQSFNVLNIGGDLRLASNGAPQNPNAIAIDVESNVDSLSTYGIISGVSNTNQKGIKLTGAQQNALIGGTIRNFETAVDAPDSGAEMKIVARLQGAGATPLNVGDATVIPSEYQEVIAFAGDLNSLVLDSVGRFSVARINGSSTNVPTGAAVVGGLVSTYQFDKNAAVQFFLDRTQKASWKRELDGGVWSQWSPVSGGFTGSHSGGTYDNGLLISVP